MEERIKLIVACHVAGIVRRLAALEIDCQFILQLELQR